MSEREGEYTRTVVLSRGRIMTLGSKTKNTYESTEFGVEHDLCDSCEDVRGFIS